MIKIRPHTGEKRFRNIKLNIMKKSLNLYDVIFAIWGIVVLSFWFSMFKTIMDYVSYKYEYIRLIELFVIVGIGAECWLFKRAGRKWNDKKIFLTIFLIALVLRVIFLTHGQYIPTNDFKDYFEWACAFANNGFGVKGTKAYNISTFAGQAMVNGILLSFFSPTLLGMQILNSFYTAGICALIYLIGKPINSKAALLAAILYTFYPISILSTQITTNHHGCTFFLLAGIYLFEGAIARQIPKIKKCFMVLLSAVFFVISNFYHPSIIIVFCALTVTLIIDELICLFRMRKLYFSDFVKRIKYFQGRFLLTLILFLLYEMILAGSMSLMERTGEISEWKRSAHLIKIVYGLNQTSGGSFNVEDYEYVHSVGKEETIELIKERLSDPVEVMELMIQKTQNAWFAADTYCYFYIDGIVKELNEKVLAANDESVKGEYLEQSSAIQGIINNILIVDTLYVNCIWLLAVIGIGVLILKYNNIGRIYSFIFIPIGWMMFITFTEMQSRYRYQSMPAVILLAAFGLEYVFRKLSMYLDKMEAQNEN